MNDPSRRAFLLQVTSSKFYKSAPPDARYGVPTHDKPVMTPNADFFTAGTGPALCIDLARWSLTVDGLVDHPLTLDWAAVRRRPAVEAMQTIACIGSSAQRARGAPLIGNAVWRGAALWPLLTAAGVGPAARRACFYAADGYSTAIDLWWLRRAVLAYEMNGEPLPAAHGAPLRLLAPGLYGQKMPKWITRIELIDYAYAGHWERQGWSDTAAVQTRALFQSPPAHARVTGAVYLQGVAYAGDRAVTRVEVSADGGPWLPANLTPPPSPYAWTPWYLRWEPDAPGVYTFRVRATDARGFTQTGGARRAFPAGTGAIDRLALVVR